MKALSGWQRIGIVISVLWLLGFPLYLALVDHNSNLDAKIADWVADCAAHRLQIVPNKDPIAAAEICRQTNPLVPMAPWDAFNMWLALLVWGPVILLWLVSWIVLATVRWIRRGFTGPQR